GHEERRGIYEEAEEERHVREGREVRGTHASLREPAASGVGCLAHRWSPGVGGAFAQCGASPAGQPLIVLPDAVELFLLQLLQVEERVVRPLGGAQELVEL